MKEVEDFKYKSIKFFYDYWLRVVMDDNQDLERNKKLAKMKAKFDRRFEKKTLLDHVEPVVLFLYDETESVIGASLFCLMIRKIFYGKYLRARYQHSYKFKTASHLLQFIFYYFTFGYLYYTYYYHKNAYPRSKLFRKVNYDV